MCMLQNLITGGGGGERERGLAERRLCTQQRQQQCGVNVRLGINFLLPPYSRSLPPPIDLSSFSFHQSQKKNPSSSD